MFSSKLISRLKNAYHIVGLVGPGMFLESCAGEVTGRNIPDFRQLSLPTNKGNENQEFWKSVETTREMIRNLKPNLGHYSLVDLEKYFNEFDLISQNIDDLQHEAGSPKIIELHGNIMRNVCTNCSFSMSDESIRENEQLCPQCGAGLKPDVLFKDDIVPAEALLRAQEVSANCEVFLMIGTSELINPALSFPYIAKGNGSYLVEINSEETQLSAHANEFIKGESAKILPHLVTALLDS